MPCIRFEELEFVLRTDFAKNLLFCATFIWFFTIHFLPAGERGALRQQREREHAGIYK